MGGKYDRRGDETVKKYLFHIKIVLVVLLFVFIIADVSLDQSSSADIKTVAVQVAKAADVDVDAAAEDRLIKRFYGLNPKDYEGAVLYAPKDNMDVNEIFIVKLKDESQAKSVEEAVQKRLDTQMKSFEGYGVEQTALLKAHVLEVRGNYIFYMVGEKVGNTQKAFLESL